MKGKPMKKAIWLLFVCLWVFDLPAQTSVELHQYVELARNLRRVGLNGEYAYTLLKELTALGPRLAGSPQAAASVEWSRQKMVDLGLENVHLEPVEVQRWVRGTEERARVISGRLGSKDLTICALGGSPPTPDDGILASVVEVRSFEQLEKMGENVRGKIVFFNVAMDRSHLRTFRAYGEAARYRVQGASQASRFGAIAVLVLSLTLRIDDVPHTGVVAYDKRYPKIPAAAISTLDAERLHRILSRDPAAKVFLKLNCRNLSPVLSANIMGEIRGKEKPEEIVVLAAHLDSWDLGVGAHDDGAGCVQVLEALRLLKHLNVPLKRTVRGVFFMNEEFGATGGREYVHSPNRKSETHIAAVESDAGGFLPLAFSARTDSTGLKKLRRWLPVFTEIGIHRILPGGGGADIGAMRRWNTLLIGLVPDSQRYFDVHHSALDVLDAVHPRELELGAIALALMAALLANSGG